MVEIQVQIPDHLFRDAKRLAAESELSFAHVVRLGLEMVLKARPVGRQPAGQWRVPNGKNMGLPLVDDEHWTDLAHEEPMKTNPSLPGQDPVMPASKDEQIPKKDGVKIGAIEMAILEEIGFGSLDGYYDENNQPINRNA